ncbi:serine protease gd-like [Ochlerotatus camptorhynchus]|uniref:serine protease gd-like n=1 Tax=Ochlerotatus camptorhynchus TaxID=644619 RepID=UPI0031DB6EEB
MKENNSVMHLFSVIYYLVGITLISARFLQSPCPEVFSYQLDPNTRQYFGRIEVDDIKPRNIARLNVDLSIGMELPPKLVGSIALVKSRQATIEDIISGQPAQYRVTFPLPNLLPTVLSIALNDRIICRGYRAAGRVLTAINLEHTLYTQLHSQKLSQKGKNLHLEESESELITRFQEPLFPQSVPNLLVRPATERTSVAAPTSPNKSICGRHSSAFLKRYTLNGELVDKGQFPWNVPLFDRTQLRNPKYMCGSTIITKKHLITAAHCVYEIDNFIEPERLLAIPGMYNIDNFFEENAQFSYVEAVIPHDEYEHEEDLSDADLAVLRLKKELVFNDYVVPICPWQGENDLRSIVGQEGYLAGWGVTERGVTAVPTYIKTTIVSRRQCNVNLERIYPNNARIFCGDGRGSTPCNGDSGSGLVLKRGNQYYLRGIVSRGLVDPSTLRCDVTKYAVYTDIALFRFWLKSVVG